MRKATIAAVAFALVGAAAGCGKVGRQMLREPVVTLKEIRPVGVGLTGGTLDVMLNVYNPNEFRLDGTRITYQVFADSTAVGGGTLDQQFTVQNGDSTTLRLPLSFTWAGLGAAARQMQNQGAVNYRVKGEIEVATPIGRFTRPYDQTGRFSLFMR
jgi:LEA14-like dessication related protein